jgi:flagellar hook assembly protein FlgD
MVDRNWLNPDKGDELKINLQQLPANEEVTIKIYNAQGVMVRALITGQVSSGQITWSGRNANDQKVASGVYLIRIDSASMHKTIRVAIVR